MSGLSWKGDAAKARRVAFDKVQEACARLAEAEEAVSERRKVLTRAQAALDDAVTERGLAERDLAAAALELEEHLPPVPRAVREELLAARKK